MTLRCPSCGADTEILSTRTPASKDIVFRRRRCLTNPDHRFTTREVQLLEAESPSLPTLEEFLRASLTYITKGTLP